MLEPNDCPTIVDVTVGVYITDAISFFFIYDVPKSTYTILSVLFVTIIRIVGKGASPPTPVLSPIPKFAYFVYIPYTIETSLFSVNTQCIVANVIKVFYMGYEDFQIPFWMFVIVCSFT